jgi:hypothetical protein
MPSGTYSVHLKECSVHFRMVDVTKTIICLVSQVKILEITLYYDGLGITTPLKGLSDIQGCEMFYFYFLNLPPHFNSSLSNNHLYAIGNNVDFRDVGQDMPLSMEYWICRKNGMEINTPNENIIIYPIFDFVTTPMSKRETPNE